ITWSEVTESRRRRVARWENQVLDGVLGPLTTRDWYVFPVAFALAGRLGWLVPAATVGAHVFWVVTLVLLLRVLRMSQVQGGALRVRRWRSGGSASAARRSRTAASSGGAAVAATCDPSCPVVAAPESTTSTNGCDSAKATASWSMGFPPAVARSAPSIA